MDWFLYDNGLRHERVKYDKSRFEDLVKQNQSLSMLFIKCTNQDFGVYF